MPLTATFQCFKECVLRPHLAYAAANLDDIVLHSRMWEAHVTQVTAILQAPREAGFTANPAKSHLGLEEAWYRGNVVCLQDDKVSSIATWLRPHTT